jgi:hypothetical protein
MAPELSQAAIDRLELGIRNAAWTVQHSRDVRALLRAYYALLVELCTPQVESETERIEQTPAVCGEDFDHDWVTSPGDTRAHCTVCGAIDGPDPPRQRVDGIEYAKGDARMKTHLLPSTATPACDHEWIELTTQAERGLSGVRVFVCSRCGIREEQHDTTTADG